MLLGCIGDDFTGSSDLANTLAKGGMRVVQYAGVPARDARADVEAGVVALKTRTVPAAEAVAASLDALAWLRRQNCRQVFFKYCSTFDSTAEGNIGPVADALLDALGARSAVVCPAFPAAGRFLFQGHLFVGDALLSESGMRDHPLTPMTDSDIRRWLSRQSRGPVGHVPHAVVARGAEAVASALTAAADAGQRLIVTDAVADRDLRAIGTACATLPLVTGGSGVALGLPDNFRRAGLMAERAADWRGAGGPGAVLSGSCSVATRAQVARHAGAHPAREVSAGDVLSGAVTAADAAAWVLAQGGDALPLVFSSADPARVRQSQERFGRTRTADALEGFFADVARHLVAGGVTRLVVAGGETSGAVVQGLGVEALEIGPEIDPGVPAVRAEGRGAEGRGGGPRDLVLALKSGNFGAEDFFARAAAILAEP